MDKYRGIYQRLVDTTSCVEGQELVPPRVERRRAKPLLEATMLVNEKIDQGIGSIEQSFVEIKKNGRNHLNILVHAARCRAQLAARAFARSGRYPHWRRYLCFVEGACDA